MMILEGKKSLFGAFRLKSGTVSTYLIKDNFKELSKSHKEQIKSFIMSLHKEIDTL